ncbi:MAG: DNA replication and repair protein RecF [Solirubrobacterales bacterium]
MIVTRLTARHFRTYARVEVPLGGRVTVVTGDNGAGKTNLLEALYFGCVGRSCRTRVDNQAIEFDQSVARVEVDGHDGEEDHTLAVAIDKTEGKTFFADGAKVESIADFGWRPPTAVFMPDRLELIKGAPGARRAHLDQFVAALWPGRRGARRTYVAALAQRNALLTRGGGDAELDAWDVELARAGIELMADRVKAVDELTGRYSEIGVELGLVDHPNVRYRPSVKAASVDGFVADLAERRSADRARGFSTYGPHRDEVVFSLAGRDVRTYGSQGQQRLSLLSLLLSECETILAITSRRPLVLLDDVMSELDATRRRLLVERVERVGQVMITATESGHVPEGTPVDTVIEVADGVATVHEQ